MGSRRAEKVTPSQKDILVSFMFDHMDFATNKLLTPEEKITNNSLWVLLCQQLNSDGPEKSIIQWQRVWKDLKMSVKRKISGRIKTRGKPVKGLELKSQEEQILKIITSDIEKTSRKEIPLYSAEPASSINSEPLLESNKSNWVSSTEFPEDVIEEKIICDENLKILNSLFKNEAVPGDDETVSTSPRNRRRTTPVPDSPQGTDNAIYEVKNELRNIGEKMSVTNELLLRIARALESK